MRGSLITIGAGAAAALALILPPAARAGTVAAAPAAAAVPAPQDSHLLAGYEQADCQNHGYPKYNEIIGTISVPDATDVNGTPGYSADVYNVGDPLDGVSAGVEVFNSGGQAFYVPYGQWGANGPQVTASFSVQPGDKLLVLVENAGTSGWEVSMLDEQSGKDWGKARQDPFMQPCEAGAFEESTSRFLTQTTPVAFVGSQVYWKEHSSAGVSKLLGTPPAGATLSRYNLVNSSKTLVAVTSNPADSNDNFTVTDTSLLTPNWAGYEVIQPLLSIGGGEPYTGVRATWKVPRITKTDPDSYAFALFLVGIGNAHGSGLMAGIWEQMVYGKVSYQAFTQLGGSLDYLQSVTIHPGDTVRAVITGSDGQGWSAMVSDLTTHHGGGVITLTTGYGQRDAEVAELRIANPLGPGFLPLAATTPVTFDHATLSAGGKTYPFITAVGPNAIVQRLEMLNSSDMTIAATSPSDSDKDGFTVRDGATRPAPPKS